MGASTSLNKGASALSPYLAGTFLAPAWPLGVTWLQKHDCISRKSTADTCISAHRSGAEGGTQWLEDGVAPAIRTLTPTTLGAPDARRWKES